MLKTIPSIIAQIRTTLNCIPASEALPMCEQQKGILIDVREPEEYAQKSANNAVNIPRGVLEMKVLTLYPNAQQAIFIHCASGVRATFAAEQLQRLGYENIWVITCQLDDVCQATL